MSKRGLFTVAAFLGVCVSLSGQETQRQDQSQSVRFTLNQADSNGVVEARLGLGQTGLFDTLNSAWYGPSPLTLEDGRHFSFPSAFAWLEAAPVDFIPEATLAEPPRVTPPATLARNPVSQPVELLPKFEYAGSEVGVFYGKSTGKYGREVKAGYILSEIVDGNTHISVGMSYQESSGRVPLLGR